MVAGHRWSSRDAPPTCAMRGLTASARVLHGKSSASLLPAFPCRLACIRSPSTPWQSVASQIVASQLISVAVRCIAFPPQLRAVRFGSSRFVAASGHIVRCSASRFRVRAKRFDSVNSASWRFAPVHDHCYSQPFSGSASPFDARPSKSLHIRFSSSASYPHLLLIRFDSASQHRSALPSRVRSLLFISAASPCRRTPRRSDPCRCSATGRARGARST